MKEVWLAIALHRSNLQESVISVHPHEYMARLAAREYSWKYPDMMTCTKKSIYVDKLFTCQECGIDVCSYELLCAECFTERQND